MPCLDFFSQKLFLSRNFAICHLTCPTLPLAIFRSVYGGAPVSITLAFHQHPYPTPFRLRRFSTCPLICRTRAGKSWEFKGIISTRASDTSAALERVAGDLAVGSCQECYGHSLSIQSPASLPDPAPALAIFLLSGGTSSVTNVAWNSYALGLLLQQQQQRRQNSLGDFHFIFIFIFIFMEE